MGRLITADQCREVAKRNGVDEVAVAEALLLYWWCMRLHLVSREVWRGCRVAFERREVVDMNAVATADGVGQFRCTWAQYENSLKKTIKVKKDDGDIYLSGRPERPVANAEFVYERKIGETNNNH